MPEELQIGKYLRNLISSINKENLWNDSHIRILTDPDKCRQLFGLNYPLLKEFIADIDDSIQRNASTSKPRYYILDTIKVEFDGHIYYVCNDLYDNQKENIFNWFVDEFGIILEGSMSKYYYVKLSCPKSTEDSDFANLLGAFKRNQNIETEMSNIPNSLSDASVGDLIFVQLGGDASKKRVYFEYYDDELKDFTNGWYALGRLTKINIQEKKIKVMCFPFKKAITKMDLYFFPQFADNFGCATKGIPNQAGLYEIDEIQALGFLDYLNLNSFIGIANQLAQSIEYSNWLKKGIEQFKSDHPEILGLTTSSLLNTIIGRPKPLATLNSLNKNISSESSLSKPFLLLAGISGTGKTRFVREQADDDLSNYQLVSVRPDWHEPSDLLGYITRLAQPEQYVVTEVLVFIVKAWKEVVSNGFELSGKTASGDISNIENIRPFWLCLDEMNLAPVEQYFADYLSVSETRRWLNDGDELIYSCDTLLNPDLINSVDKDKLKKDLGLDDGEEFSNKLWAHFCDNGISIPFNLIVAGTVNMDETTHGFSRKVIDRALSFDFGDFFPNTFSEFFEPTSSPKSFTYPIWSHADRDSLAATCDPDGERTIKFMEAINEKLDGTPFKLAYRALNEVLLSVIANNPKNDMELLAIWDDFVMCKLLPRIEGDLDKLSSKEDNKSLLQVLSEALADNDMLGPIWGEEKDSPDARPDLYREKTEGDDKVIRIPCRSKGKLDWMQARLKRDTFTSFWP